MQLIEHKIATDLFYICSKTEIHPRARYRNSKRRKSTRFFDRRHVNILPPYWHRGQNCESRAKEGTGWREIFAVKGC